VSLEAAVRKNALAGDLLGLADAARDRYEATRELADLAEALDFYAAAERLVRDAALEVKT
jgi:hypothetical protein